MSDEFGTVNVRGGDRAREIEVIRQHYRQHRETLQRLAAGAPTEYLAGEYSRLIREIDVAIGKLDELEGRRSDPGRSAVPQPPPTLNQPFTHMPMNAAPMPEYVEEVEQPRGSGSRVAMILLGGLIVLAAIGWLIWRASSDRGERPGGIIEEQTTTTSATEGATETGTIAPASPVTPATPPASDSLSVIPPANDYGSVRKGTRVTRQFEVANNTDAPLTIDVARSACRCLFYEYQATIPPKGREGVTVTIDGSRAKTGPLTETIRVSSKKDPAVATSFTITANIR